jgi:hypothetical protein
MNQKISRKKFFKDIFKYSTGAAVGAAAGGILLPKNVPAQKETPPLPWPYAKLDPDQGRILGHDYYSQGGCGYAGFAGILKQLQDKQGEPFTRIPAEMFGYAGGGVKGWGTICGALNGAAAALSLVCDSKSSGLVIDELIGWYTESLLPTDTSNLFAVSDKYATKNNIAELPQNKSGSPLCHISLSGWCAFSGFSVGSPEQLERCSRLSGDVVAKATALLNAQKAGTFKAEYLGSKSISDCLGCHDREQEVGNVDTKMSCVVCHDDPHS